MTKQSTLGYVRRSVAEWRLPHAGAWKGEVTACDYGRSMANQSPLSSPTVPALKTAPRSELARARAAPRCAPPSPPPCAVTGPILAKGGGSGVGVYGRPLRAGTPLVCMQAVAGALMRSPPSAASGFVTEGVHRHRLVDHRCACRTGQRPLESIAQLSLVHLLTSFSFKVCSLHPLSRL